MQEKKPALLILIDYPDFNLLLAAKAKKMGIPVFYYISPQVWAWRSGRVKKIGKLTNRVGVILPFEKDFYASRGIEVDFVGHPLKDTVKKTRYSPEISSFVTIISRLILRHGLLAFSLAVVPRKSVLCYLIFLLLPKS